MFEKGITFSDLSRQSGLSKAAIHNLLTGSSTSRRGRQSISNALACSPWPDVLVSQSVVTLPVGTEIFFPTIDQTMKYAAAFAKHATRRGKAIVFMVATRLTFAVGKDVQPTRD